MFNSKKTQNKKWNKRQKAKMPRAQLARVEWKIDQIDARTQYLSRVINNVQNASDAIWGNTRPMMPWYFALPVAALLTATTLWPLREAGTAVSPAIDGAYTYTRYAGEAVGAWFASIQYAKPAMAFGQTLRGLTNAQTADLAEKLRQRENGGRYQGWNKYGYAGAYQAGASALAQTGFIHRDKLDAAEDCIKSGSCGAKHLAFLQNTENWAYGYNFQQFMDSPSIQDKFFVQLANYNIDQGFRRGVLRADKPSRIAGFVAVAHLQGVGAAVDYYLHGIDTKKGGAYASEYAKIGESAAPDIGASELAGVDVKLVEVVGIAQKCMHDRHGVDITVIDGLRTRAEQAEYMKAGTTTTMNSLHLKGKAVDLTVSYGGKRNDASDWMWAMEINKCMSFASSVAGTPVEWGGNWKSFKDGFHWQLPRNY